MENNEIVMTLHEREIARAWGLFQYDYGQRLILEGVDLPSAYEVHFSNNETGESKTRIGDSSGVDIPDEFLLSGESIHVWLFLHVGEDDGETEYHGIIGVVKRAKPTDNQPTPVQQDVITQAIAALNEAVETTGNDVVDANAAKKDAEDARDASIAAKDAAVIAQGLAEEASENALTAKRLAEEAQAGAEEAQRKAEEAQSECERISEAIPDTVATALQEAKDSGEFDGATFVPSITYGVISWTNDRELPNPDPVDLGEEFGVDSFAKKTELPTKVSDLENDSGFLTTETDPTVPSWAKQSEKPTYTASEVGAIDSSQKGSANGVAELDENGKVKSSQLPSYVDDVIECNSISDFPATGESGKIYVAKDTNKTYRWGGSTYVEISESLALGETSSTAYPGDKGKVAYDHATDSARLTTAKTSGLYKIAVTDEGHIASVTAVERSDLEALLPVATTTETQAIISDWGVSA